MSNTSRPRMHVAQLRDPSENAYRLSWLHRMRFEALDQGRTASVRVGESPCRTWIVARGMTFTTTEQQKGRRIGY
jgi:hypothetical protein